MPKHPNPPPIATAPPAQPRRRPYNYNRHLQLPIHRGVPKKMRPWYLRGVEAFLKALSPEFLSRFTAGQVIGYLQEVSSLGPRIDWKFRQLVDALQLLC